MVLQRRSTRDLYIYLEQLELAPNLGTVFDVAALMGSIGTRLAC